LVDDQEHTAATPQPKEFSHGFHGFHGLEMVSDQRILIRVIRAIRGKIFAKRTDPELLQYKEIEKSGKVTR
jgi:hypothetical protein